MNMPLQSIIEAMPSKPDGWYSDLIKAGGIVVGDQFHISTAAWLRLSVEHHQFGDVVSVVAKPIARAIGKDPSCGGCAKRGKRLNGGGDLV